MVTQNYRRITVLSHVNSSRLTLTRHQTLLLKCNLYGCFSPHENDSNTLKTWIFKGGNKVPMSKIQMRKQTCDTLLCGVKQSPLCRLV